MLEDKLNEVEQWIEERENEGEDVTESREILQEAEALYGEARAELIEGDYNKAERLINESYQLANSVLPPPAARGLASAAIAGIVGGACAVAGLIFYLVRRRRRAAG